MPATPPAPEVKWVSSIDGGHVQVSHIVRFVQESERNVVVIWTIDGKLSRSEDAAFFPPAVQQQRQPEKVTP